MWLGLAVLDGDKNMIEIKNLNIDVFDSKEYLNFIENTKINFKNSANILKMRIKKEIGKPEINKQAYGLYIDNSLQAVTSISEINNFAYHIDHFPPIHNDSYKNEYDDLIIYTINDMIIREFKVAYVYTSETFYNEWISRQTQKFVEDNVISIVEKIPANGIIQNNLINKRLPYYSGDMIPGIHDGSDQKSLPPSLDVDSVILHINYQY